VASKVLSLAVLSDLHAQYLDPNAWNITLGALGSRPVDVVVLNGDTCDFGQIGKFDKRLFTYRMAMQEEMSLMEEIIEVKENIFRRLRKACPKARIVFRIGNHEERFTATRDSHPEALSTLLKTMRRLRSLELEDVLDLDKYGIEMSYNDKDVFGGCYTTIHGHKTSKTAIEHYLHAYGSGTSGHTHSGNIRRRYHRGRLETWAESMCLCRVRKIPYLPFGNEPEWVQGFITARIKDGVVHQHQHVIHNTGNRYELDFYGEILAA
jgi:hypothetical protein